ncbi:hypothetical protein [Kyrpidia spormannii]|uniref:Uncharacterized protein n=1 Tax=Kyrpidia spormannii TaxID=2055160 RepID=A0A6F9EEV6_9BACL|nr:hypothetical protein [Kyrpidia spormannii]CAB3395409.1 conserved protein of unknown function [Kyrpidia spormannii]
MIDRWIPPLQGLVKRGRPEERSGRRRQLRPLLGAATMWIAAAGFLGEIIIAEPPVQAADSPVHIRAEEVVAVPVGNQLKVFDSFTLDASAGTPVNLHLPRGHSDVQVATDTATSYTKTPEGVSWPGGLPPGVQSLAITYALPFDNGKGDIEFSQPYNVDNLSLLIPQGRAALIAQGLYPVTQVVDLQGMKFRRFTKPDLPAGVPWTASIQAIPQAGEVAPGSIAVPPGLPVIGAGYKYTEFKALINLLLVAFVVILGVIGLRRRQERLAGRLSEMHKQLVDQWASLEIERRRGAVPEEEYRRRRGNLLRRLLAVERQKRSMGHSD